MVLGASGLARLAGLVGWLDDGAGLDELAGVACLLDRKLS